MKRKMILILGGARSGKSSYAQILASRTGEKVIYVATAEAKDEEMEERIATHRKERPASWKTVEAPISVGKRLSSEGENPDVVLLDCVTLLASNVLMALGETNDLREYQKRLDEEIDSILSVYGRWQATWIIVSNEVGLGLVPAYEMGRTYRDGLGRVNQRLAQNADEVIFMVAGLPMNVK